MNVFQFIYDIKPIAFSFMGFDVYWYGLAYLAAFLLGREYVNRLWKPQFDTSSFLNYLVIGILVGGKIGQILLYDFSFQGALQRSGMSFHGGLLGAGLACYLFTLKSKVSFWHVADMVSVAAPIGLFFGRIANSINQEILGTVTESSFGVSSSYGLLLRHPVTIYEAITEGLLLFLVMFCFRKKPLKEGILTGVFVAGYAIARFFPEFFKATEWFFIGLTYGQVLSVLMFVIGVGIVRSRQY